MMSKTETFKIRPGIYNIPNFGRVVATKPLEDNILVKLYLADSFPFIQLKEGGVSLLKKEKLHDKDISRLIIKAKSILEVDLLLEVKNNKTLSAIAETKKNSFTKTK